MGLKIVARSGIGVVVGIDSMKERVMGNDVEMILTGSAGVTRFICDMSKLLNQGAEELAGF